ncbi:hypothetical protein ACFP4H_00010 [Pseudophaeobacter arcticus]|uniref:hypothetical protein n=1 Tax=Pseudophaeobacter arcticus TaxID=385492 RepID=UPI000481F754
MSAEGRKTPEIDEEQVEELHATIVGRACECHRFERTGERRCQRFFGTKAEALGREVRRGMIEPNHPDLSIARSSYYYEPKGETEQNLDLMRQIDDWTCHAFVPLHVLV